MGKIHQCCYTNAIRENNGIVSSGWQAVAVSEDISQGAFKQCVNLQNKASNLHNNMVDENGNIMNAFEIHCDDNYVCILRTQYGLHDGRGRANMFSHGYILDWNDALADPNVFLTISDENFKSVEDDALEQLYKPLIYTQAFSEDDVLEKAGLSLETYQTLIRCIYARLSEKSMQKPVFIQYDGDEMKMRALLYCIFYGLPYYLRKQVSATVAGAVTQNEKIIVFSQNASKATLYFIPETGENSVLTERLEKKIERFGYIDFAVRHFGKISIRKYFDSLEHNAINLGDPSASDELIMKIAFQYMLKPEVSSYDDYELEAVLSDVLRSAYKKSGLMEEYCSQLLEEFSKREFSLTDESEASLNQKLLSCETKSFAESVKKYYFERLYSISLEDAAKKLASMPKALFDVYVPELARMQQGSKIIDLLYADRVRNEEKTTFSSLKEIAVESDFLASRTQTAALIEDKAWQLYCDELEKEASDVWASHQEYMAVMAEILVPETVASCSDAAKEAFWEKFNLKSIDVANMEMYQKMEVSNERSRFVLDFCKLANSFLTMEENQFLFAAGKLFDTYRQILKPEDTGILVDILAKIIFREHERIQAFVKWLQATADERLVPHLETVLALKKHIEEGEYETVFAKYAEYFQMHSIDSELMKTISYLLKEICIMCDSQDMIIPLDLWLLLGIGTGENAFNIFDGITPCLLEEDNKVVVESSALLQNEEYVEQAEQYVKLHGEQQKYVKKLLSELKLIEKERRKSEKKTSPKKPKVKWDFFKKK